MRMEVQTDKHGHWLVVGNWRKPIMALTHADAPPMPDIDSWFHLRHAYLRVESGWEVSLVWSSMSYSDNREVWRISNADQFNETPEFVEVGIINSVNGELALPPFKLSAEGLIGLFDWLATVPTGDVDRIAKLEGWIVIDDD